MSLLIIDGNNVMGSRPWTRWWRDRGRAATDLRDELEHSGLAELEVGEQVLLVFDGRPPAGDALQGRLETRFAGSDGLSADDLIVDRVSVSEASEVTVVTSDRELAARVVALGARIEGSGTFLRRAGLDR